MQENLLPQKCEPHKFETVAYDLDSLAQLKDRYLCLECLANQSPYRQTKTIREAQQKFKEMTMNEFNDKKNKITQNLDKLQNVQQRTKEFQEYFTNRISESIKILKKRISDVQNELNTLIEPQAEMQTEQDLINLSNYVNFGFNKNLNNKINPKNFEFIDQIKQQLDQQKFEEHLINISHQLQSLQTQSLIEEQANIITSEILVIDFKKNKNLRYLCQKHNQEIIMICLESGQIEERFFCQNCIKEKGQQQLKTIQDVNKLWQSHLQNMYQSHLNFYDLRQNNQNKVNELIVQYQKFSQEFFNELRKQIINQNNKIIKEINDSQFSILNKQLYQMELKEIEFITQTLSQNDPLQELIQKQFQIQKLDQQYKDQIMEQLNLQRNKLMEIQLQINQLFRFDLSIQELRDDQLEQYFSQKLFPQFYENYLKFKNQYKVIIDDVQSKLQKSQIKNKKQQSIHQKENQIQLCKQILEQLQQIEKVWLKQVSFSTHNLQNQLKFQIKRSQNNLTTQNLHIQQQYPLRRNLQLMINKISDYEEIQYNSWFIYRKNLKFSDKLKHSTINLNGNCTIATTQNNNQTYATCICDQPIPQVGQFTVDFKIYKLYYTMIGICNIKFIKKDFNFDNYSIGHGYYGLINDGYVYSHHDSSNNYKNLGFEFNVGDIINITVNQQTKQIVLNNKAKELSYALEFLPSEDLYFCCALQSSDIKISEVEII